MKTAFHDFLVETVADSAASMNALLDDVTICDALYLAASHCINALRGGLKILIAGNGGSAADAQHFAGELVSRFSFERPALAAIALTTDTSIMTAVGNDYGYNSLFSRQIQALGVSGDVFIAISTSGNSQNVLYALQQANEQGLTTIGLTGRTGGKMNSLCDTCICVPSDSTPRIQESHLVLEHTLCAWIEQELFGKEDNSL
ncbi:D-sedoheptulose-7-phosphate isomerase [Synechococcus sp. LTW-G]